jgi:hypothetical protein
MTKASRYTKMTTLLMGLYYYYHNSPLNRSNLKRSFAALDVSPVMPSRVGGTRWLPHTERALDSFWIGYTAIKNHLEQVLIFNLKFKYPLKI